MRSVNLSKEWIMRKFCLAAILTLLCHAVGAVPPGIGDQAPDFTLQGSDGATYRLSQFLGKQSVILAFFPKAFTGG